MACVLADVAGVVEAGAVADTRVRPDIAAVVRAGVGADAASGRGRGLRKGRRQENREADGEQQRDTEAERSTHVRLLLRPARPRRASSRQDGMEGMIWEHRAGP